MKIEIVNVKRDGWAGVEYVGRGRESLLGNKFVIGQDGDREMVIEKYRAWLYREVKKKGKVWEELLTLKRKLENGEKVQLGCWCAPERCHAEVIKNCLTWMVIEEIS